MKVINQSTKLETILDGRIKNEIDSLKIAKLKKSRDNIIHSEIPTEQESRPSTPSRERIYSYTKSLANVDSRSAWHDRNYRRTKPWKEVSGHTINGAELIAWIQSGEATNKVDYVTREPSGIFKFYAQVKREYFNNKINPRIKPHKSMSAKATLDVTTNIDESLVTTEPVINGSKNGSTPEKSAEIVNIYIEGAYQCDNNMCANIAVEETAPKLYKWVIVNDGNTKLSTIPSTENELLSQAIYEIEKNIKTIIGNNAKPRYVLNKDPLNNTCNYINVFHSDGRYVDKFKEDPEEYERLIDRWSLLFCPSLAPEKRGESIEAEVIKRLPNKWGVIQVSDFCGVKLKAGQYIPEKRIIAMGSVKQKLRLNKSHGYNTGIDIEEWWLKFFNNYSCDLIIYESSATTPTENFFFIEVKGCAKSNKSKQVELTETQTETCDAFPNQFRLAACRYKLETKGNSHEVAQVTIEYFKITKNDSGLPAIAPCPDIDPRESTKSPTIQTPRTYLITLV